jgi:TRAP transporter TAXI family solute receptor
MGRLIAIGRSLFSSVGRSRLAVAVVTVSMAISNLMAARTSSAEEVFASIGTGELSGVYYPVGKAICKVIAPDLRAQGIRCSPETTPGSVYNVGGVQSGELEFGIVQSDVQFAAVKGIDAWNGRPASDLRSVLSLYPELATVIARAGANIHVLEDLAGKRINVGNLGTGTRATWEVITAGRDSNDSKRLTGLNPREAISALCSGAIDANFLIVGHPSPLVSSQLDACTSNFVKIAGPTIDKLLEADPFYVRGSIPTELYGISADVPTFGSLATLVTSAATDARVVAAVAKTILSHVAELRTLHPALARLHAKQMIAEGLTAPLHPAAAAVYKELGLLK